MARPLLGLLPLRLPLLVYLLGPGLLLGYKALFSPTPSSCLLLAASLLPLNLSLPVRLPHRLPEPTLPCELPLGPSMAVLCGRTTGLLLLHMSLLHHRSFLTPPAQRTTTRGRLPTFLYLYFLFSVVMGSLTLCPRCISIF